MKQSFLIIIAATVGLVAGGLLWSSDAAKHEVINDTSSSDISYELQSLQKNEALPAELVTLLVSLTLFAQQQKAQNETLNKNLTSLKGTVDVYVPRGPIGFNGGRAFADPND